MIVTTKETQQLISADKVEGAAIYDSKKEKIGSVRTVMLGKRDGKIHHAILSVGGPFGMGNKLHSVPWAKLDYDTELDGYRLDVTREQLKNAASFDRSDPDKASDRDFQTRSYSYFGETASW